MNCKPSTQRSYLLHWEEMKTKIESPLSSDKRRKVYPFTNLALLNSYALPSAVRTVEAGDSMTLSMFHESRT